MILLSKLISVYLSYTKYNSILDQLPSTSNRIDSRTVVRLTLDEELRETARFVDSCTVSTVLPSMEGGKTGRSGLHRPARPHELALEYDNMLRGATLVLYVVQTVVITTTVGLLIVSVIR